MLKTILKHTLYYVSVQKGSLTLSRPQVDMVILEEKNEINIFYKHSYLKRYAEYFCFIHTYIFRHIYKVHPISTSTTTVIYIIRNISRTRRYLTAAATEQVIHAFTTRRLDVGNATSSEAKTKASKKYRSCHSLIEH